MKRLIFAMLLATFAMGQAKVDLQNMVTGVAQPANGGSGVANTATLTLGSSNQNWATLGTGLVKNTVTTGALSNPTFLDIVALWASCSGTQYLGFDGNCHTANAGTVTNVSGSGVISVINGSTTPTVFCPTCNTDGGSSIGGIIVGENFAVNGATVVSSGSWSLCGTNPAARGTYPIDYMPFPISGYIRNPVIYMTSPPVIGSSQRVNFTRSNQLIPDLIEGLFGYIENTTAGAYGSAAHSWRVGAGDVYELTTGTPTTGGAPTMVSYGVEFSSDGNYDGILCSHWTMATNAAIAAGTTFLGPYSSNGGLSSTATEALAKYTVPYAGTFSNMFFWINLAGTGTSSTVLTFRKNGADCGLTRTLGTEAAGLYVDVTNTCLVAAGDQVNWQVVCTNGSGACAGIQGISIAFKATSGGCDPTAGVNCSTFVGSTPNFTATAGTTNYSTPFSKNINTTEANQRFGMPRAGVLSLCNVYVGTAGSGGNSTVLTVMKNGVAGSSTATISSGTSGSVAFTGTDTFAAKDRIDMRIASTGGVGPVISSWSCGYQ